MSKEQSKNTRRYSINVRFQESVKNTRRKLITCFLQRGVQSERVKRAKTIHIKKKSFKFQTLQYTYDFFVQKHY